LFELGLQKSHRYSASKNVVADNLKAAAARQPFERNFTAGQKIANQKS
jgi:hypothetical protein